MYAPAKRLVLALFRAPSGEPEAPAGSHASVRVMRASPRYLTYRMLPIGVAAAALAALFGVTLFAAVFTREAAGLIAPIAIGGLGGPALALAWFCTRVDFELRYYVLTDRSVRVREGAWLVDEKTITYANVQNVRVEQGPLQRLLGISDVRVDTAGGGASVEAQKHGATNHGVVLAGIENAGEVRDAILEHLRRRSDSAGLGDLDDERHPSGARAWRPEHVDLLRDVARAAAGLRAAAR